MVQPLINFNNNIRDYTLNMRRQYTPTKSSLMLNTGQYTHYSREANKELSIAREFEALKLQAKQLQITNRQLSADADKLRYEKSLNESKLLQKASFQEQAMAQFQKEKNHQLDLIKVQNQQNLNRLRRQYDNRVEDMQRQISSRELLGRQLNDQYAVLEKKAQDTRGKLERYELQLVKLRDANSSLTEQVTREEFANKKLEMLAEELERQRFEMEEQIRVLLDIEADKSRTIGALDGQLGQTERSVASLNEKLALLTENFNSLEEHISVMKERLLNAEMRGEDLDNQLSSTQLQISDREGLLAEQKERELKLRGELEGHRVREEQRVSEIRQLMADNERIYGDLNVLRFRLYDVSIQKGIDV